MTYELPVLFGAGVAYLILLFLIAYATDQGKLPERWVRNPFVYSLSLGVYATSWSYYGSVGFADQQGFQFLTIYLGVTIAFALSPVLLQPILRLTREYQLISLADLFAFRYRSQVAGILVTLFMLVGTLPYVALQIRAVTESLRVLTQEATPQVLALGFCLTLILFAILFGARHISPREKHRGLVVAIAFESLVKLAALSLVGLLAVFGVFNGPSGLESWLDLHPEAVEALYRPVRESPWSTLLLLAFAAAFLLPRQFHMTFTENSDPRALRTASWALPLYLLLFNLAIPPVLWAGTQLRLPQDPDYYVLGITMQAGPGWLPILTFLGGVSAASAMVIVSSLALSAMCLNHLLLPASYPDPKVDLYRWLLWSRRVLIALIILAGYAFYILLEHQQGLVQQGLISFVAVAQFLPGMVGVLYWRRATWLGFVAGLLGGILIWSLTLLLPMLESSGFLRTSIDLGLFYQGSERPDRWEFATFWSLAVNGVLFVTVSLLTRQREEEAETARACTSELLAPMSGVVAAGSPQQFAEGLAATLGRDIAEKEVARALEDLKLAPEERRSSKLRRLRDQIERNLSGLMGPQMAHMIVNQGLRLDTRTKTALTDSWRHLEERLEDSRLRLQGLSADLDRHRRYHRQILQDLPLGVCAVSQDQRVVIWNLAMEVLSGVRSRDAVGRPLNLLPAPWGGLLAGFAAAPDEHIHHREVRGAVRPQWFNLHKASILDPDPTHPGGTTGTGLVMLLEDLTDLETLEAELAHSERLASVGRLAAGVAHEIGNPVTGIASLAQNLREEHDPATVKTSIEEILHQTQRIARILRTMMTFSRGANLGADYETFGLRELVDDAIRLVQLTRQGRQVRCDNHCPANLELSGDRQQLSQVLVNLFTNACDASGPGDRVEVLAFAKPDWIQIEIQDQGEGIPEHIRERIFEPFVTTKKPGEGTGLGLSLVYRIVEDHGGQVEIDSVPGTGTRAVIRLPRKRLQQSGVSS
jgi:Na+/proline symporter/nitrogen-specific signal transduction histidine kinase